MNPRIFPALAILLLALLSACAYTPVAPSNTMQLIYPRMYQEAPLTIMILPPLNQSTAADAKEYFACSLSQAVGQRGYYVMPVEAMFTVLREEGMYDTENITPEIGAGRVANGVKSHQPDADYTQQDGDHKTMFNE